MRSIEFIPYSGTVFNLSVEGDKSYIVRGATVHNCRCDVMAVSAARAEHEGWKVSGPPPRTVESIDKATGEVTQLPVVPDKGWNRLPTLDYGKAA